MDPYQTSQGWPHASSSKKKKVEPKYSPLKMAEEFKHIKKQGKPDIELLLLKTRINISNHVSRGTLEKIH